MDLTLFQISKLILYEDWESFIELLKASNLSLDIWVAFFAFAFSLPLLAVGLYFLSEKITRKHPLPLSKKGVMQALFCLPVALFLWDFSISKYMPVESYQAYEKKLLWKRAFVSPKRVLISQAHSVKSGPSLEKTQEYLHAFQDKKGEKPNIYLFIIESLRKDFIQEENSPTMKAFERENYSAEHSFSNANYTQGSWYSIFYSDFLYRWTQRRKPNWKKGSIPLNFLKKMGYSVHVYSSAGLRYYRMDEVLFGKKRELLDSFYQLSHLYPIKAWETDQKTLELFSKEVKEEGQIHIFFWDATHFDYSWPKSEKNRFEPIAKDQDYYQPIQTEMRIQRIQNNYRNAIYFIDTLFASFVEKLKMKGTYKNSIIIVTGDHGEEFNEKGRLFHASHLSKEQTEVPILLRLPNRDLPVSKLATHMDIFPTVFEYLGYTDIYPFEGESLYHKKKWPFAFCCRFNGGKNPYEFFLHDGKEKVVSRFYPKEEVLSSHAVEVLSIQDKEDQKKLSALYDPEAYVLQNFKEGLNRIFSSD